MLPVTPMCHFVMLDTPTGAIKTSSRTPLLSPVHDQIWEGQSVSQDQVILTKIKKEEELKRSIDLEWRRR